LPGVAVARGAPAPPFELPDDGGGTTALADLVAGGPALLAFFKPTCPTCRLAFPVFGELERRYGDAVPVVAVTQDDLARSRAWLDELGFAGRVLDDSRGYAASAAYDLDSVPTLVLVAPDGTVVAASAGWDRDRVNAWDEALARMTGRSPSPVSVEGDGRPPWKPG
jgi:peroxiredoxin